MNSNYNDLFGGAAGSHGQDSVPNPESHNIYNQLRVMQQVSGPTNII